MERLEQIESSMEKLQKEKCLLLVSMLLEDVRNELSKTSDCSTLDVIKERIGSRVRMFVYDMDTAGFLDQMP